MGYPARARLKQAAALACAATTMVVVLASGPALAQTFGGRGGDVHGGVGGSGGGVGGGLGLPGAPGTTPPTIEGANGGGGGGGGGAGGGAGGAGAASEAGAPGGGPGTDGSSACCAAKFGGGGGGGGNGGTHGATTADPVIDITTPLSGMAGGAGGKGGTANGASSFGGGGGGGGAGGYGLVVTGPSAISNTSTIAGGAGGAGGNGGNATLDGGNGGWGGSGGIGVYITVPGAKLTNSGTIQGGTGGLAGLGGTGTAANGNDGVYSEGGAGVWVVGSGTITTIVNTGTIAGGNFGNFGGLNSKGSVASGGDGISGSDLVVINSGTISGGIGANSVQTFQANAITFTGGVNTLELQAGYNFIGNVVAFSPADTLRLGGASNAQFDASQIGATAQYRGFGVFELNATADTTTWKLINTPDQATPWNLVKGVLSVGASDNLGPEATSPLTFNGGTLQVTGTTFTDFGTRIVTWNGGGFDIADKNNTFTVSQALNGGPLNVNPIGGRGTLKLTASDTFTTTDVFSGALLVDGTNSLTSPTVTVHTGSTLAGNNAATINGNVSNAGTLATGFGRTTAGATMTINGNYAGQGGTLAMNTQLGDDSSLTDQLVINGTTSGMTGVVVTNAGGKGAMTTGAGIQLIVTQGGDGTFSGGGKAGAFQYVLFHGPGGASGDPNSWYLRSHSDSGTGGPLLPPGEPVPLYRPEVSIYSVMAGLARQQELTTLGTFHERNGDQRLAGSTGTRTAAWGRLFGQHLEQSHWGHAGASFEGNTGGLQSGLDVAQWVNASGHQDRFGLFAAYARTTGDVRGFSIGVVNAVAGRAELDGTSVGAYWTHLAPSGWYAEAVLMGTRFDGEGSAMGDEVNLSGYGAVASIEGGYPIAIAPGVRLEPQAQLVYQHINFHDVDDPFAHVAYDTPDALFGRVGVRLSADLLPLPYVLRPYLKANVWQDFTETDTIRFSGIHQIWSRHEATTLELGGGIVAQLSPGVGLWASAEYTTDIGGSDDARESVRGTAGLRVVW